MPSTKYLIGYKSDSKNNLEIKMKATKTQMKSKYKMAKFVLDYIRKNDRVYVTESGSDEVKPYRYALPTWFCGE